MHVDSSRATLNNLVEDVLKPELGYSSELSIRNSIGLLYDPDFEDNLTKKFTELGIKNDSMLVIVDEDDAEPHVDLSIAVTEKPLPEDSKPVVLPTKVDVARKAKNMSNGNGTQTTDDAVPKHKRSASPAPSPVEKKGRTSSKVVRDDSIVVNDTHEGAITIDD